MVLAECLVTVATGTRQEGGALHRRLAAQQRQTAAPPSIRRSTSPGLNLPIYADAACSAEHEAAPRNSARAGFDEVVAGLSEAGRPGTRPGAASLHAAICSERETRSRPVRRDVIFKLGPSCRSPIKYVLCTGRGSVRRTTSLPRHGNDPQPALGSRRWLAGRNQGGQVMGTRTTMDGKTAVAHVAYRVNEGVCAIFPITPSSRRWPNWL